MRHHSHHHSAALRSVSPASKSMWPPHHADFQNPPISRWVDEYENQRPQGGLGGFDGGPSIDRVKAPIEIFMKILCSASKMGGVIGNMGSNVRQLQQETGADIHVEIASSESEELVIRVSSIEAPWDPRSQTIEAILQLQVKTSEDSEKGITTTRLLVPSSKVGCLLGEGGQVINEMWRRTWADISVLTKKDKPKRVSSNEELVQGCNDAFADTASRLRDRVFRDANGGAEVYFLKLHAMKFHFEGGGRGY